MCLMMQLRTDAVLAPPLGTPHSAGRRRVTPRLRLGQAGGKRDASNITCVMRTGLHPKCAGPPAPPVRTSHNGCYVGRRRPASCAARRADLDAGEAWRHPHTPGLVRSRLCRHRVLCFPRPPVRSGCARARTALLACVLADRTPSAPRGSPQITSAAKEKIAYCPKPRFAPNSRLGKNLFQQEQASSLIQPSAATALEENPLFTTKARQACVKIRKPDYIIIIIELMMRE